MGQSQDQVALVLSLRIPKQLRQLHTHILHRLILKIRGPRINSSNPFPSDSTHRVISSASPISFSIHAHSLLHQPNDADPQPSLLEHREALQALGRAVELGVPDVAEDPRELAVLDELEQMVVL